MSNEAITLGLVESYRLVKWDASVGENPPTENEQDHPACIEIWEVKPDGPAQRIYARTE